MELWSLPETVELEGRRYTLHTDFRDILEIFSYLEDPDLPEPVRWRIALGLFYEEPVPPACRPAAMAYLSRFLSCGRQDRPGPRLICWQHDADAIIAGVNKAAGQELRALRHVHWWTFLSWFHAIGEGQLSALVAVREKLRRGLPLSGWEKEFYRENRQRVELPKRYSRQELARQAELERLLDRGEKRR